MELDAIPSLEIVIYVGAIIQRKATLIPMEYIF